MHLSCVQQRLNDREIDEIFFARLANLMRRLVESAGAFGCLVDEQVHDTALVRGLHNFLNVVGGAMSAADLLVLIERLLQV